MEEYKHSEHKMHAPTSEEEWMTMDILYRMIEADCLKYRFDEDSHRIVALEDGCEFWGKYDGEMRNGIGVKKYPNRASFIGMYVDDVRHGDGFKIHADDSVHRVSYINGELQTNS
tara:strand:+ start:260 stop:604 length:345 start_codon:yes stop_codon:yes gene_type:complete